MNLQGKVHILVVELLFGLYFVSGCSSEWDLIYVAAVYKSVTYDLVAWLTL